ncbi:hypothetical protein RHSIM_Rhsim06G0109900 [Rhododendron simsii]|uniref:W2 domain-containing protein n=1 Tax=Rhododendron simsii TaxID=118357 RepID=A0A834GUC8_RHOSS|nr:hypothetical protein RHSIM_Rhsim06G0109900 [Rhododendron simsii]
MITKIEGRGNGIKANVVNMVDIAKALGRPASYTTKFFGCELGAQSKFDEKTGTSHVNGAHDTAKLAGLLENFIKKYVQCYGCGNPETEILINKAQMITLKCVACGFLSDVDMRDKLTTFIIKNPPEQKKGSKDKKAMRRAEKEWLKEGEMVDEEQTKLKKKTVRKEVAKKIGSSISGSKDVSSKSTTKKKNNVSDGDHSPTEADDNETAAAIVDTEDDDDIQWQTDTSAEAARKRIQEQLSSVTAGMVMLSTNEERPKSIKEFLNKGTSASQLKSFLGSLSGTPQEIMDSLFEAPFDGAGKGFSKEVTKKKNYLADITQEEGSQLVLLNAIEIFCGQARPEAAKEVALVLKVLYDSDLLEKEFIVEWYGKGLDGSDKGS